LKRTPCVSELLDAFLKTPTSDAQCRKEIIDGLQVYFNEALGAFLLYRFERQQYAHIKQTNPDTVMADIYGAEHLLRLFVKLPSLLSMTNMDDEDIRLVCTTMDEFLQYVAQIISQSIC